MVKLTILSNDEKCPIHCKVFKQYKDLPESMYWTEDNTVGVTNEKAVGILYIDDRGFRYDKNIDSYKNIDNINKILQELEKDK